jgi:hypothetical protein
VRQPIVVRIGQRLGSIGIVTRAVAPSSRARPSAAYAEELAALRSARDELRAAHPGPFALIGRSFGGRMCALLAATEPPDALAIVGHPISPPGRPRPRDEEALAGMRCPTLVVQGDRDELGPLPVLERIAADNPLIDVVVIAGGGHDLSTAQESEAADHVARWLSAAFASGEDTRA